GQTERLADLVCEPGDFFALRAFMAVHMQRFADHDLVNLIFFCQAADGRDVGSRVFSPVGWTRLGCEHKGITNGNTNRLVANVESHNPHNFMIQPGLHRDIIEFYFLPRGRSSLNSKSKYAILLLSSVLVIYAIIGD